MMDQVEYIYMPDKFMERYGASTVLGVKSPGTGSAVSNELNYSG